MEVHYSAVCSFQMAAMGARACFTLSGPLSVTDSCATLCLLSTKWVGAPAHTCVLSGVCVFLNSSHAHEQASQELLIRGGDGVKREGA